jgi:hypothetical protein
MRIVWPPSRWRILPIPATFDQPGIVRSSAAAAGAALPYLPAGAGVAFAAPVAVVRRRRRLRSRRG